MEALDIREFRAVRIHPDPLLRRIRAVCSSPEAERCPLTACSIFQGNRNRKGGVRAAEEIRKERNQGRTNQPVFGITSSGCDPAPRRYRKPLPSLPDVRGGRQQESLLRRKDGRINCLQSKMRTGYNRR